MKVAALVMAALALAAHAQEADRPDVRVGDQWQFVVYYGTPSAKPNRHWVVTAVTPTAIEGTENGEPLRLTRELNLVESPLRKDSNSRALDFPLRVGKTWSYIGDTVFKDNKSTAQATVNVVVVAHERVRVVAGEFDAFKVVATGSFQGLSRGGPGVLGGDVDQTYWYAPAARAVVKSVSRNPYRGTSTVELVEAALQP